jgi:hypothetical protein
MVNVSRKARLRSCDERKHLLQRLLPPVVVGAPLDRVAQDLQRVTRRRSIAAEAGVRTLYAASSSWNAATLSGVLPFLRQCDSGVF